MKTLLIGLTAFTISASSHANLFMKKGCEAFSADPQACYQGYVNDERKKNLDVEDAWAKQVANNLRDEYEMQFESIETKEECSDYLASLDREREKIANDYQKIAVFVSYKRVATDYDNEVCSIASTQKSDNNHARYFERSCTVSSYNT